MATIAIASAKGGCGKTTLALLLGAELALDDYRVTLLDSDLNQHASAFGRKAAIPGFSVVPDIEEKNVLAALRQAEAGADVVLIDLPGGSSTLALKALQRSHLVLVPAQASLPDVRDAIKTIAQIDDAQDLARAPIARAVVWTRLPSGFESRAARHVRESLEATAVPVLRSAVMERAAFREMHISGRVPRQDDPAGTAAANVAALTREVLDRLAQLSAAA
jgi:chromosome partitioning protein